MRRKVLIVDDDRDILLTLKDGLEKYDPNLSALTAEDGHEALDILRDSTVSLVLTDLKMPGLDGFGLMAEIMEQFPEIPVIVMTGYSTPELENLTREGGAFGYIRKPFQIEQLAERIKAALNKESEGGTLDGISSSMFLQLIEMEQKTCTIRVVDKPSGKQGVLFFQEGEMLDARADGLLGEKAAYEIFSWDQVSISIENACPRKGKKIHRDLKALLIESMRLKDEERESVKPTAVAEEEDDTERKVDREDFDGANAIDRIKGKLEKEICDISAWQDIYQDSAWDSFVAQAARIGAILKSGQLKLCYIERGESNHLILLPGKQTTLITLNPTWPKDRIIETLSG